MEALLASVVLPAVIDLFKNLGTAASRRFIGLSVDDQVKLMQAEVGKLQALSALDNPHGTPSQWVVDTRAIFRYAAAGLVIVIGAAVAYYGFQKNMTPVASAGLDLIGMPFGFIFGERMYLGFKGGLSK